MKEVNYVKNKPYLVDDEHRHVEIVEIIEEKKIVEEKKVVDCEYVVVEERKAECCKVEGQKMMKQNGLEYEEIKKLMSLIIKKKTEIIEEKIKCCRIEEKKAELIRKLMLNATKKDAEIIHGKKVKDIKMLKSSRKLVLSKRILKVIARERGAKIMKIFQKVN